MNKVTQDNIDALTERRGGVKLTIYMPTHKISTPATIQEDQTRYKNLVRKGHDEWRAHTDEDAVASVIDALESKYDDEAFWRATSRGLAVFADEQGVEFYHLPIECEERVCVGESFDVTPLHLVQSYDQSYYVLALAMHNSKLFKGDAYGLEPVEMDFPASPEAALGIDEMFINSNTQRGYEGPAGSNYQISPHGSGDSSEAGREERLQYLRIIDGMVTDSRKIDTSLPLVVAATDSEAGDYKAHSKSTSLVDIYIPGNYTKAELHELHDLSWKVIHEEVVDKKIARIIERFNEQKGIQKASSDPDDIREAVKAGRVDTLLLRMVDETNDSVSDAVGAHLPLIRFDEAYEQENLQSLAESVIQHGGTVTGVDPEVFTVPSKVGALYRY